MAAEDAPPPARRRPTSSPWSSDEGRQFLQERIATFSRVVFLISLSTFAAGWIIALLWAPWSLHDGLPTEPSHLFQLGSMAVQLTMWLATRGSPLPAAVLGLLDGMGMFLICLGTTGMSFTLPQVLRPDLLAVLSLFGLLLYRAAVVPSEPRRTFWIGVFASAPLPVMTYLLYSRSGQPPGTPSAWAYSAYALLFAALAVLLSTTTSRTIYGLRQTVREARRLGPYTLVEKIGEGGMGAVYRAQHALLRRPTAIKILPPERAGQMDLARFEREVQMTSLLTSPHTVSVYDFGRTPDGLFYYAMEYLDGIDLDDLVRRGGPMPPGRVIRVLRQVCEALGEAHREGLIHRDVKPANILLCERGGKPDFAKVVDFGLVKKVAGADPGVTAESVALGTPHYMSPEALRSPESIDARSDVYALGATAYFLLTGHTVFEGSLADVFAQLLTAEPQPPSKRLGQAIPPGLDALVLAALAKDPNDRPESVDAFEAGLSACRDVPPWTDAQASAWWRGRREAIRAERSPKPRGDASPQTLSIGREAGTPAG